MKIHLPTVALQYSLNFLVGPSTEQMRLVQAPNARQMPPFEPCAFWIGSKWATAAMHAKSLGLVPGITLIPHSIVHPLLVIHDSFMAWRKYCSWLVGEHLSLDFWVCFSLARYLGLCPVSFHSTVFPFPYFTWTSSDVPVLRLSPSVSCSSALASAILLFLLLSFFLHLSFFCSVRLVYAFLVLYMHTKSH